MHRRHVGLTVSTLDAIADPVSPIDKFPRIPNFGCMGGVGSKDVSLRTAKKEILLLKTPVAFGNGHRLSQPEIVISGPSRTNVTIGADRDLRDANTGGAGEER